MQIPPTHLVGNPPALVRGAAAGQPMDSVALETRAHEITAEIERLLRGHTSRGDEKRILELLRGATREDLNAVLQEVNVGRLVSDVDNHCLGPRNRTALLKLLSSDRLAELTVATRACVIDGLQKGKTHADDERAIRDIFLDTRGAELTELKNRVDAGNDYRDLHQLVFHDIDSPEVRQSLLDHFQTQAQGLPRETKVLSDIDDTFYCNWKDPRYP
ncbi:MAG: hypothetical protein AB1758_02910, partial [Candidatus Eremiobacterota bacterium]